MVVLPMLVGICQVGSWKVFALLIKKKERERDSTECPSLPGCLDAWMHADDSDYEATSVMSQERDVEGGDADLERALVPEGVSEQIHQLFATHFLTCYVRNISPSYSNRCFLIIVVSHPNTDLLEAIIYLQFFLLRKKS